MSNRRKHHKRGLGVCPHLEGIEVQSTVQYGFQAGTNRSPLPSCTPSSLFFCQDGLLYCQAEAWLASTIHCSAIASSTSCGPPPAGQYQFNETGDIICYSADNYESGFLHHAKLGFTTPLPPSTQVFYRCGDPELGMSPEFSFVTQPEVGPQSLPYRCDGQSIPHNLCTDAGMPSDKRAGCCLPSQVWGSVV